MAWVRNYGLGSKQLPGSETMPGLEKMAWVRNTCLGTKHMPGSETLAWVRNSGLGRPGSFIAGHGPLPCVVTMVKRGNARPFVVAVNAASNLTPKWQFLVQNCSTSQSEATRQEPWPKRLADELAEKLVEHLAENIG